MIEPGKLPQNGSPPGRLPPVGADEATKAAFPPRPRGLLFLIAVLKKQQETGSSRDKR
jgi:hypothetical protein